MHDYFYHNLGQTLSLTGTDGTDLGLQPTEELSFAGAHLYAYSYIYNKKAVQTAKDVLSTSPRHRPIRHRPIPPRPDLRRCSCVSKLPYA